MLSLEEQKLIVWLDASVKQQQYGTFTLTIMAKEGQPVNESAKLVKMRRKKYKLPTAWQTLGTVLY